MRNSIAGGHEEKQKQIKKDREVLLGQKQNNNSEQNIDLEVSNQNQTPKVKENHSPHQDHSSHHQEKKNE